MRSPGNFPGFLATIIGLDKDNDIAVPKIKPLASIDIIASECSNILLSDISLITFEKVSGCCSKGKISLKTIPCIGKST